MAIQEQLHTDKGEFPTPPDVKATMALLKQAAKEAGASTVQAAEAAIAVAAQHHATLESKPS